MTAKEVIDLLFTMRRDKRELDFTFNQDTDEDISGWYGVKFTKIFDEYDCLFAIGYYGGGSTEVYDVYGLVDNSDNEESVKQFCTDKLQKFMNTWCDSSYPCEKICVEIKNVAA
jgi:hypothetical protein